MHSASLTFALAMAAGTAASVLARHARVPAIVLLLATGVLLGPDVAGVVQPHTLGPALQGVVGFAVAVILFEGGLNLELRKLRAQARSIQRLITVGALVTALGGTLAARLLMGWDWRLAALFGTLVIVTGPTVVTPILRRVRVRSDVASILEAEGLLIDAVGATIAVVALDVVLHPSPRSVGAGVLGIVARIGFGTAFGLVGGAVLALLLRWRRVVPEGLENVLGLATAAAVFQGSSALVGDSGITAVIVAGMVVGNVSSHALHALRDFKEQLTTLFIATLFVLLAADVRLADVQRLGTAGVLTVAALVLVVRPLDVWASTAGSALGWRERTFLSWLAPRGIVAAAVASLFTERLRAAGIAGGTQVRALVFLVIAITVTTQGLTAGLVARLLGLRQERAGFALLGANALARRLALALREAGHEVVLIDAAPDACRAAEEDGLPVLQGNGLEEDILQAAGASCRLGIIATTQNEDVNFLCARRVHDRFRGPTVHVALESEAHGVTTKMVEAIDAHVLFGAEHDLELWANRLRRRTAVLERWTCRATPGSGAPDVRRIAGELVLPLVLTRGGKPSLVDETIRPRAGDELLLALLAERREDAARALAEAGWEEPRPAAAATRVG